MGEGRSSTCEKKIMLASRKRSGNEWKLFVHFIFYVSKGERAWNIRNEKHFRLNFQTFFSLFYLASCNCLKHVGNFHRCGMKPEFSIYLFIPVAFLQSFLEHEDAGV